MKTSLTLFLPISEANLFMVLSGYQSTKPCDLKQSLPRFFSEELKMAQECFSLVTPGSIKHQESSRLSSESSLDS